MTDQSKKLWSAVLAFVGILGLLSSLCGAFFSAYFFEALWRISVPSLVIGGLVAYLCYRTWIRLKTSAPEIKRG